VGKDAALCGFGGKVKHQHRRQGADEPLTTACRNSAGSAQMLYCHNNTAVSYPVPGAVMSIAFCNRTGRKAALFGPFGACIAVRIF